MDPIIRGLLLVILVAAIGGPAFVAVQAAAAVAVLAITTSIVALGKDDDGRGSHTLAGVRAAG
jgi:hypothetical protein